MKRASSQFSGSFGFQQISADAVVDFGKTEGRTVGDRSTKNSGKNERKRRSNRQKATTRAAVDLRYPSLVPRNAGNETGATESRPLFRLYFASISQGQWDTVFFFLFFFALLLRLSDTEIKKLNAWRDDRQRFRKHLRPTCTVKSRIVTVSGAPYVPRFTDLRFLRNADTKGRFACGANAFALIAEVNQVKRRWTLLPLRNGAAGISWIIQLARRSLNIQTIVFSLRFQHLQHA